MILNFKTELKGSINGQLINVSGSGTINEAEGLTEGNYDLHQIPNGFDPLLLGCMKVTGYPNACKEAIGVTNPFKGISYEYERSLDFGEYGHLELTSDVDLNGNKLLSKFNIKGQVQTPEIKSIEPLSESWTPLGKTIEGLFRYGCKTVNGEIFYADAKSIYAVKDETKKTLHRFIDLDVKKKKDGTIKITQKVFLYENLLS